MKSFSVKSLPGLILGLALSPIVPAASDGVIHFYGSIVNEGCLVTPQQDNVALSCFQNGKSITRVVSPKASGELTSANDNMLQTSFQYLDGQHKLAILRVVYK